MSFLTSYAANLVSIAGIVGAYGLFTGEINDLTDWFKSHPEVMIPALIVHLVLYALYWKVMADVRELERRSKRRR